MMNGWDGGMSATGWFFMSLFWILLVLVVIWAAANLFPSRGRFADGRGTLTAPPEDPRAILDLRLARGEIDVDTYDTLRAKLEAKEGSTR